MIFESIHWIFRLCSKISRKEILCYHTTMKYEMDNKILLKWNNIVWKNEILPVAKVSDAGKDMELVIDLRIHSCRHDLDMRKCISNCVNT